MQEVDWPTAPGHDHARAATAVGLCVVAVGAWLPSTPLAHALGFQALPADFFAALIGMVLAYLVLIEVGKGIFYRIGSDEPSERQADRRHPGFDHRHQRRRVGRVSTAGPHPALWKS